MKARVIGVRGQRALVRSVDNQLLECLSSRQRDRLCCGDIVMVEQINDHQCSLIDICPRETVLYRADPFKKKWMAANISQVVIITAVAPSFSHELITRILIACQLSDIKPLIVLNKVDLQAGYQAARDLLAPFEKIGIAIIETSQDASIEPLLARLDNERSLLIGQSGMGKSTLLNRIIPSANALTKEISSALNSGKHTTTASTWYEVPDHPIIIDSPGLQQFGLFGYDAQKIESSFDEFLPYLGHCRFLDCQHKKEPGCAISQAVSEGMIDPARLAVFHKIIQENQYTTY